MNVPVLDLIRQYESIREEMDAAVLEVIRSGKYVLGPYVKAFEEEAAAYCGAKHAIGVASGTDALLLSLRALGVGPGDSVILPSFTFFATAGVVHNVGATPVFCDIRPDTFNLDPDHLREILSAGPTNSTNSMNPTNSTNSMNPRFRAVIPVHLYGQMADMDEILAVAEEYGLAVVEDAAQAIGATYSPSLNQPHEPQELHEPHELNEPQELHELNEPHEPHEPQEPKKAGTLGATGCFSFYPTKNLGAYGDGGMITTNDDELAERLRMLRVHGAKPKYFHKMVGVNSRLDAIQAAILGVKLQHLDEWFAARAKVADRYDELLGDIAGVVTPHRADGRSHIFHQYTIRVRDGNRDALKEHLQENGVGSMIYYPKPLHLQECFSHLGYREGQLPECEAASSEALSLPIFPEITPEEQGYVCRAIRMFGE